MFRKVPGSNLSTDKGEWIDYTSLRHSMYGSKMFWGNCLSQNFSAIAAWLSYLPMKKKKTNLTIGSNMEWMGECYVKWNMSSKERQVVHVLKYMYELKSSSCTNKE